MAKKKKLTNGINIVPDYVWTILSLILALIVWQLISLTKNGGKVFAAPMEVFNSALASLKTGALGRHFFSSLKRILLASAAFVCSLPVVPSGWYNARRLVEPWIQFLKNIRPSYIPLVVVAAVWARVRSCYFIACFLTMTINLSGVRSVVSPRSKPHGCWGQAILSFLKCCCSGINTIYHYRDALGLSSSLTTLLPLR